jgi:hypothetical protein
MLSHLYVVQPYVVYLLGGIWNQVLVGGWVSLEIFFYNFFYKIFYNFFYRIFYNFFYNNGNRVTIADFTHFRSR